MILHPIIDLLKRIVVALPDYIGGGEDTKDVNAVAEGTWWPQVVVIDTATTILEHVLSYMYGAITLIVGPQVTSIGYSSITYNPNLTTLVVKSAISTGNGGFTRNSYLKTVDLMNTQLATNALSYTIVDTLILRNTSIVTMSNINALGNTPFANGGTGGTIYIPKTLYDHLGDGTSSDYKSATNWATIDGYGTITWQSIEGSYYETHYADGTVIS